MLTNLGACWNHPVNVNFALKVKKIAFCIPCEYESYIKLQFFIIRVKQGRKRFRVRAVADLSWRAEVECIENVGKGIKSMTKGRARIQAL